MAENSISTDCYFRIIHTERNGVEMSTTVSVDSEEMYLNNKPGAELGLIRSQKGYTAEYVAGKLHLRIHLIELLEADEYEKMPEPVFIKGYLRAYAKLLEISPEPFIERFNLHYGSERRTDRALWQSRKRSYKAYKAENTVRSVTLAITFLVFIAVVVWWSKTKEETLPTSEVAELHVKEVKEESPHTTLAQTNENLATIPSVLPSLDQVTTASSENLSE
jgi:cytoskeleton protein RodZ